MYQKAVVTSKKRNKVFAAYPPTNYSSTISLDSSMASTLASCIKENKMLIVQPNKKTLGVICSNKTVFSAGHGITLSYVANKIHANFLIPNTAKNILSGICEYEQCFDVFLEIGSSYISGYIDFFDIKLKVIRKDGKLYYYRSKTRISEKDMSPEEQELISDLKKYMKITEMFFSKVLEVISK